MAQTTTASGISYDPDVDTNEFKWDQYLRKQGFSSPRNGFYDTGGRSLQDLVNGYNKEFGANATFEGGPSGDRVNFGDGTIDAKTAEGLVGYMDPRNAPAAGAPGGGGGGGNQIAGFTVNNGIAGGGFTGNEASDLYHTLMQRAGQSLDVQQGDPNIRRQADAFAANQTRQARNLMDAEAEKQGPSANLNMERRIAGEHAGQAAGQFEGQLIQKEIDSRRQEIQNALQLGAGLLTQEQQMALQEELHKLDLAQQESQFGRQLGLNAWDRQNYWDYQNSPLAS